MNPCKTPNLSWGPYTQGYIFPSVSPNIYVSSREVRRARKKTILCVSVCLQIINSLWGAPELFHLLFAKFRSQRFSGASVVQGKAKALWALADHRGGIWAGNRKALSPPGRHPVRTETILAAGGFYKSKNRCLLAGKQGTEKVINAIVCHK